jgi:aminoglycoside phosphotransferase (APT) family kinase protein
LSVLPVPVSPADFTAEWFAAALADDRITGVQLERLGGLSSVVHRVRLMHPTPGRSPASVIVKIALSGIGASPGFDREVQFYRELAPLLRLPVPRPLCIDADEHTGAYVLVLEDAGESRALDDLPSPAQTEAIVTAIAQLHAAWWSSPELERYPFLRTLPDFIDRVERQLPRALPRFLERFGAALAPAERALFEKLARGFRRAVAPLEAAPCTLVHHDLQPGNILFRGGEPVLIDWQLAQRSPAVRDLGFFIASSTGPYDPARELSLLERYHSGLAAAGVNYPRDSLLQDYRRSVIADFGRMAMSGGQQSIAPGMRAILLQQISGRTGSVDALGLAELMH